MFNREFDARGRSKSLKKIFLEELNPHVAAMQKMRDSVQKRVDSAKAICLHTPLYLSAPKLDKNSLAMFGKVMIHRKLQTQICPGSLSNNLYYIVNSFPKSLRLLGSQISHSAVLPALKVGDEEKLKNNTETDNVISAFTSFLRDNNMK